MTDEIKNALSDDEWEAKVAFDAGTWGHDPLDRHLDAYQDFDLMRVEVRNKHATAALCLFGQPFGFTREDVEAIEDFLSCSIGQDGGGDHILDSPVGEAAYRRVGSLVARIASLLPPEPA